MAEKNKIKTGWGIVNAGILVYPSIRTTKREATRDYANSARQPWSGLVASGMYKCKKVTLHYAP